MNTLFSHADPSGNFAVRDHRSRKRIDGGQSTFPMATRRVVITGLGMLSPLGPSVTSSWNRLIAGESGIVSLLSHPSTKDKRDEFAGLPSTVAGVVDDASWLKSVSRDEQRQLGRFAQMALAASREALQDAKIQVNDLDPEERERIVRPFREQS